MLKYLLKTKIIALVLLMALSNISGQTYCFTSPQGYGAGTTGGGNASVTTVTSQSALQSALTASGSAVILVSGTISCTYMSVLVNNKTILGLPGARLRNLNQTKEGSGIMNLKPGSSNVIMRNLIFEGPGAYDTDGRDLLTVDGSSRIWVDHCEFQDGCDGNYDHKGLTDNVTVSWCKFTYLKPAKSGGSGGTNDHRFSNLVGSSDSDKPSDGKYSITWQYCWWAQGCVERMTRARNAQLHMLNCYWNSSVTKVALGLGGATDCFVENSVFANTGDKYRYYNNGTVRLTSEGSTGAPANVGTCPAPTYTHEAIAAGSVVSAITSSCGAGATLNVTSSGAVSANSSCGGGTTNKAPTVSITSPANNASFTAPASITVNATATDSDGSIAKVEFYNGTTLLGSDNSSPYTYSWANVATGNYSIKVIATDDDGATAESTISVSVSSAPSCTASITTGGSTSFCQGGSVTLTASQGSSYIWRNGSSQVGTAQTFTATGSGSFTVEVTCSNGAKATSSATVVTLTNAVVWFADSDGDGLGDANTTLTACTKPNGYVATSGDQCPSDANKTVPGDCGCGKVEGACTDCAGVANGTAYVDNCTRCVGGNTNLRECSASFQAEEACEKEGTVEADPTKPGFLGTGFLNTSNAAGTFVMFGISANTSGTVRLGFRYGNTGSANRTASISINGNTPTQSLSFVITPNSPNYWTTEEIEVPLMQGNNTIRLTATTADGLPNLDFMYILGNGFALGNCTVTSLNSMENNASHTLYPNPTLDSFTLHTKQAVIAKIYNAEGQMIEVLHSNGNANFGGNYKPGIYILRVENGTTVNTLKIAKE